MPPLTIAACAMADSFVPELPVASLTATRGCAEADGPDVFTVPPSTSLTTLSVACALSVPSLCTGRVVVL